MIPWTRAVDFGPAPISHERCPCCMADIGPEADFARYGSFVLARCSSCRFVFVGNPLSASQLDDHYRGAYARVDEPLYHSMQHDNARMNMRWIRRHGSIAALLRRGARPSSLDVGAGFGYLVAELDRWGFDAMGTEPSPFQRRFGEERLGVRLIDASLESLAGSGRRFDLITLCDVIEHIVLPREVMGACARLLKPGGRLVVKTDNFRGMVARLMGLRFYRQSPIEHVSQFSPASFDRLARDTGFQTETLVTWTPGSGMRWAIKLRILSALGRRPPPIDPVAIAKLGCPPSRLARMTDPVFAMMARPFDIAGSGAEFLTVLRKHGAEA